MKTKIKTIKPSSKYIGPVKVEAEAARDKIIKAGGIAWIKDETAWMQPGRYEWVGYYLHYITFAKLSSHVDKVRHSKSIIE